MNFSIKIIIHSFGFWITVFQASKWSKFAFSAFLQYAMIQLGAAYWKAWNSQSWISFICEGAESGPWYLEKCKICIIPPRSLGVTGSGDKWFSSGRISCLSYKDDHLLTLGVTMEISKVVECRIVWSSSYSTCWVHVYLNQTGLLPLGQRGANLVSFWKAYTFDLFLIVNYYSLVEIHFFEVFGLIYLLQYMKMF